jgi:hypothetical protein
MKSNPFAGITRPSSPTLSDIQRRMVELTGTHLQLKPQPCPAPSTPWPPSVSPNPILGDAALYGVAGLAICRLAPHCKAHPAAILLQLLAAFGNAVSPAQQPAKQRTAFYPLVCNTRIRALGRRRVMR